MPWLGETSQTGYRNRRFETRARTYFQNIEIDKVYILIAPDANGHYTNIIGACRSMAAVQYYKSIYGNLSYKLVNMWYPERELVSRDHMHYGVFE